MEEGREGVMNYESSPHIMKPSHIAMPQCSSVLLHCVCKLHTTTHTTFYAPKSSNVIQCKETSCVGDVMCTATVTDYSLHVSRPCSMTTSDVFTILEIHMFSGTHSRKIV